MIFMYFDKIFYFNLKYGLSFSLNFINCYWIPNMFKYRSYGLETLTVFRLNCNYYWANFKKYCLGQVRRGSHGSKTRAYSTIEIVYTWTMRIFQKLIIFWSWHMGFKLSQQLKINKITFRLHVVIYKLDFTHVYIYLSTCDQNEYI